MLQTFVLPDLNWTVGIGVVVICYYLYLALDALYNVFLHPLSKFPGPPAAAASHVPYVYASLHGDRPYWIKSLHDRYDSSVVRISPRELSFINAEVWKDVYGEGGRKYEKDSATYGSLPNGTPSLLTANVHDHARMRKVLDHAFSNRAFREQEPVVAEYINLLVSQLCAQIQSEGGAAKVNVLEWFSWTAFDVIGDLAFGDNFECLQKKGLNPWVRSVNNAQQLLVYLSACNRFALTRRVLPLLIPKVVKSKMEVLFKFGVDKVGQRMELGTKRPDFMSEILKFNDDKTGLSLDEIHSNAFLFIAAGSDSISSLLTATMFYLLQHPAIMKKLTDEIFGAFKSEAELDGQSLSKLPYLVACLDETHRSFPGSLTGQAVVVPAGGDTIGNDWCPGGTGISTNFYAIYHSERNFKDPEKYVPERWLGDPRYAGDNRAAFHPFSYGARNCIGKNIGILESQLILAKMIWNFKIERCEETETDWTNQKAHLAFIKRPLIVKLTKRTRSANS
ncbi:hypothetical protein MMC07_005355 [Pseudocyphellaria aurata]|nr:hypothetical protein [Pseudocyphellaria aurata]